MVGDSGESTLTDRTYIVPKVYAAIKPYRLRREFQRGVTMSEHD